MFELRFCTSDDIEEILELQEEVFDTLGDDSSLLRRNTEETFRRCLKNPNFILGIFDENLLIGIAIMEDARGREDDLGILIEKNILSQKEYADFKLVFIKKEYYGLGIQRALMWVLEKNAYKRGYQYLLSSVSPYNEYSRRNIIKMGYVYKTSNLLYGGLEREVYLKQIEIRDFNLRIIKAVGALEGKEADNDLILEGVDLEKCIEGVLEVASTGDIIEYIDMDSGREFYGLYIHAVEPLVLICDLDNNKLSVFSYSDSIGSLRQNKIWIDTVRH